MEYLSRTNKGPLPAKGKVEALIADGALPIPQPKEFDPKHTIVVVVDNGPFEAAGYIANVNDFWRVTRHNPHDTRPKIFLSYPPAKDLT
jgi:hypothetical protein